jgi:hypothetical protein
MKNLTIKWHQIVVSLLLGFALGVAFGHWRATERFHGRPRHGDMKQHMMERFNKELGLSSGQTQQVAGIFEGKHSQMEALQTEMRPKFEALRALTEEEIRKVLNPDQQKKFEKMNTKMKERMGKHKRFPPPPPPEE